MNLRGSVGREDKLTKMRRVENPLSVCSCTRQLSNCDRQSKYWQQIELEVRSSYLEASNMKWEKLEKRTNFSFERYNLLFLNSMESPGCSRKPFSIFFLYLVNCVSDQGHHFRRTHNNNRELTQNNAHNNVIEYLAEF